jgi:hypothetical protein
MILTWLWKLVLWFRHGGDAAGSETSGALRLGEELPFHNDSNDRDHADPVIFEPGEGA